MNRGKIAVVLSLALQLSFGVGVAGSTCSEEQAPMLPPLLEVTGALFESSVGQTVAGFLGCVDLDCVARLEAVVHVGQPAVEILMPVALHGVPDAFLETLPVRMQLAVRVRAVGALGAIADVHSVDVLLCTLLDEHPLIRVEAVRALGAIDTERSLLAIVPVLRDPDSLLRETAAEVLAKQRFAAALPCLRMALEVEVVQHVRDAMERAVRDLEGVPSNGAES